MCLIVITICSNLVLTMGLTLFSHRESRSSRDFDQRDDIKSRLIDGSNGWSTAVNKHNNSLIRSVSFASFLANRTLLNLFHQSKPNSNREIHSSGTESDLDIFRNFLSPKPLNMMKKIEQLTGRSDKDDDDEYITPIEEEDRDEKERSIDRRVPINLDLGLLDKDDQDKSDFRPERIDLDPVSSKEESLLSKLRQNQRNGKKKMKAKRTLTIKSRGRPKGELSRKQTVITVPVAVSKEDDEEYEDGKDDDKDSQTEQESSHEKYYSGDSGHGDTFGVLQIPAKCKSYLQNHQIIRQRVPSRIWYKPVKTRNKRKRLKKTQTGKMSPVQLIELHDNQKLSSLTDDDQLSSDDVGFTAKLRPARHRKKEYFPFQYNVEIRSRKGVKRPKSDPRSVREKFNKHEQREEEHWHEKSWDKEDLFLKQYTADRNNDKSDSDEDEDDGQLENRPKISHSNQDDDDKHFEIPSKGFKVDERFSKWVERKVIFT